MIARRKQGTNIGFSTPIADVKKIGLEQVTSDDLVKFGMIPEFIGRFPVTVTLAPLGREDLMAILTDVKDNLQQQYKWLLQQDGIELNFATDALEQLVERAQLAGTGARALQSELERVMLPHMYHARDYYNNGVKQINITAESVINPEKL
jgi:ATP-dependent Clp protease ATP-binding subunit ClpX